MPAQEGALRDRELSKLVLVVISITSLSTVVATALTITFFVFGGEIPDHPHFTNAMIGTVISLVILGWGLSPLFLMLVCNHYYQLDLRESYHPEGA